MSFTLIADIGRGLDALEGERCTLDGQIAVLHRVLRTLHGTMPPITPDKPAPQAIATVKPSGMTPAAREAVSDRMKAYWAKRKAQVAKGRGVGKAR